MIRSLTMAAVFALSAGAAQGAFTGVQYIQGNSAAATAAIGAPAVTFRIYAGFDGLGDGVVNTVLATLSASFFPISPGTFYIDPDGDPLATGLPPNSFLFGAFPAYEFTTFATIGVDDALLPSAVEVIRDPDGSLTQFAFGGTTSNGNPINLAGAAVANPALASGFGTLLYQITVLTNGGSGMFGGSVGQIFLNTPTNDFRNVTSLISGSFTISEASGVTHFETISTVPAPGAMALFGVAGLAAARRRRISSR